MKEYTTRRILQLVHQNNVIFIKFKNIASICNRFISLSAFCYYTSKMDTMCIDISNRKVDTIYLEGRKTFLMESHLSRVFHSEVN